MGTLKKIINFFKKGWNKFKEIIVTKEWIFSFPAFAFAIIALVFHSLIGFFCLVVWIITLLYNTDEE